MSRFWPATITTYYFLPYPSYMPSLSYLSIFKYSVSARWPICHKVPACLVPTLLVSVFCSRASFVLPRSTLTLWNWELLERPQIMQPVDSFPAFYGTRSFITAFTRALHVSLSWARPIQSTPPQPISKRSILILSTHLRLVLSCGLFPSGHVTN
jgi:hypothetical protein